MPSDITRADIEAWLMTNGWFPGRDIQERADELVTTRLQDAQEQGFPLVPLDGASSFIHTFGLLRLPYPKAPEIAMVVKPTVGYQGDAAEFAELAQNLGHPVFPVGYETSEQGIVLIDDLGRFFYQHDTGHYFLGNDDYEAFACRLDGGQLQDAEDFYV